MLSVYWSINVRWRVTNYATLRRFTQFVTRHLSLYFNKLTKLSIHFLNNHDVVKSLFFVRSLLKNEGFYGAIYVDLKYIEFSYILC